MKHNFFGGVHPRDKKSLSRDVAIAPLSEPPVQVIIPMAMHVGEPCTPLVSPGDTVCVGQKIGSTEHLGVSVHASVSGTVTAVELRPHPDGEPVVSVVIGNDFLDTPVAEPESRNVQQLSQQELLDIVREAGIVELDGAGIPIHVKLTGAAGKVDTVIVSGAECDPYLTANYRLMTEQGSKILGGAQLICRMLDVPKATIGVEAGHMDVVQSLRRLAQESGGAEVRPLRVRYPQGGEKQLVQTLTGRQVPPYKLPEDVGCAVFSVGTAAAVYDAVYEGKPLTHRVVTVTGEAIQKPANFWVPIGTPMEHLLREAGGCSGEPECVLTGGAMTGLPQQDLSAPVTKQVNSLVVLPADVCARTVQEPVCIRCGRCVEVCPMHLLPLYIHLYASHGRFRETERFHVADCMECGSCTYNCPGGVPLVQSVRATKHRLRFAARQER